MSSQQSLLPNRGGRDVDVDATPSVLALDDAGAVFEALGSTTARQLVGHIYDEPRTASDLSELLDTSLQNVHYHLDRLLDADLVTVIDTWYSPKGREMKVYGPTSDPLVVFAGASDSDVDLSRPGTDPLDRSETPTAD